MGRAQAGGMHSGSRPGAAHVHGNAAFPHRGGFVHGGHGHFAGNGRFVHGFHNGVARVWWVSGGVWYPYYYPYAYPAYSYAYPAPAYPSVAYYCASAGAYYPDVAVCPEGWMTVIPNAPAY